MPNTEPLDAMHCMMYGFAAVVIVLLIILFTSRYSASVRSQFEFFTEADVHALSTCLSDKKELHAWALLTQ